jgi:hypothetical protein
MMTIDQLPYGGRWRVLISGGIAGTNRRPRISNLEVR